MVSSTLTYLPSRPLNCCGDEERLRKEAFDLASTRDGLLILVGEFFDAQDGDDVLQFLIALEHGFHGARNAVMLLAQNARIENAREAGQRIDSGINAALDDLPAEVGGRVEWAKVAAGAGSV